VRQNRRELPKKRSVLAQNDVEVLEREGIEQSDWVVVDCYDFLVHIMTKDVRERYNLDKLWGDGRNIRKFETIEKDLAEKAKKAEKKSLAQQKTDTKKAEKQQKKEEKTTKKQEKETTKKQEKETKKETKKPAVSSDKKKQKSQKPKKEKKPVKPVADKKESK
jgi:outer membrane biosynthesis protein TonB